MGNETSIQNVGEKSRANDDEKYRPWKDETAVRAVTNNLRPLPMWKYPAI